jgi:adenine-specific DNA-methyltransferase
LLADSGSILVQIGDENVHRVRTLMDEVFGDENFISLITIAKTGGQPGDGIPNVSDHILWFCRAQAAVKLRSLYLDKIVGVGAGSGGRYTQVDEADRNYRLVTLTSARPPGDFPISFQGAEYRPVGRYWTTGRVGATRLIKAGRVVAGARPSTSRSI